MPIFPSKHGRLEAAHAPGPRAHRRGSQRDRPTLSGDLGHPCRRPTSVGPAPGDFADTHAEALGAGVCWTGRRGEGERGRRNGAASPPFAPSPPRPLATEVALAGTRFAWSAAARFTTR